VQVDEVDYAWLLSIKQAEAAGEYDKKRSPAHVEEFREWVRQVPGLTLDPTADAREQLLAVHDAVTAIPTREMFLKAIARMKGNSTGEEVPDPIEEEPLE
jgi:GGDEF domain-containing protein